MNETQTNETRVEEKQEVVEEKNSSFKELMQKNVSTLIGGILIGGVTLIFLLTLLIIWLAK